MTGVYSFKLTESQFHVGAAYLVIWSNMHEIQIVG